MAGKVRKEQALQGLREGSGVKGLVAKLKDPSWSPGTHVVEGENGLLKYVHPVSHTHIYAHLCTHTHT